MSADLHFDPSTPASPSSMDLRRFIPTPRVERLANGLTVCIIENHLAPVVATAMVYRAGTRDEVAGLGGVAHFLEHMMFKGSSRFGSGEIDRLTQRLGGSNNAFTSHDSTLYYFTFAADRWHQALEIEADRMASLTLDPAELNSERRVVLEEIAMYEGEPWDALDQEVSSKFFGQQPYGQRILGSRESLAAIDGTVLADFHRQFYCPSNAILVVAGDVDGGASGGVLDVVTQAFGNLSGGEGRRMTAAKPGESHRAARRVERYHGEVARLLMALPAPPARHQDHPFLSLLVAILASGRASRLHRALVDEGQLCSWVDTDLQETLDPGAVSLALEVIPGVSPQQVEEEALSQLAKLRAEGPTEEEVARAKKILLADWILNHERVHQQAFLMGSSLALFDLDFPFLYFDQLLAAGPEELGHVAQKYLDPNLGGVIGWSYPQAAKPGSSSSSVVLQTETPTVTGDE